jgi:hypothetical protein
VSANVGKDGLGHREALRVKLSPPFTVLLADHPSGKVGEFHRNRYPQIFSFPTFVSDTPQLHWATLPIFFLGHIYFAHQTIYVSFFRFPPESFPLGAQVVIAGLLIMKIL